VFHIKKYLGKKLSFEGFEHLQITVSTKDAGVVLDEDMTLGAVREHFAVRDAYLVLHYRMQQTPTAFNVDTGM
jgi:hypothetical protein